MTTILFLLISQQSFAGCEGCCSKNGGVVCFSGITICKDHKPLSVQCLEKCNKCQNYSNNKNKNKKSKKKKFDYSQLKYTRKYLNKLYQRGGNLFFCNNSIKRKTKYSFMHIISQEKLKKAFNKVSNKKYDLNKILADPINIVPVLKSLKIKLSGKGYGEIKGEKRRFGKCNLEVTKSKIEPRDKIKGDIARVFRYMEKRYHVSLIHKKDENIFNLWELEDPINSIECQRISNHTGGKFFGIFADLCE